MSIENIIAFAIGVAAGVFITRTPAAPCPREQAGYACRKEKGQKCECEE